MKTLRKLPVIPWQSLRLVFAFGVECSGGKLGLGLRKSPTTTAKREGTYSGRFCSD